MIASFVLSLTDFDPRDAEARSSSSASTTTPGCCSDPVARIQALAVVTVRFAAHRRPGHDGLRAWRRDAGQQHAAARAGTSSGRCSTCRCRSRSSPARSSGSASSTPRPAGSTGPRAGRDRRGPDWLNSVAWVYAVAHADGPVGDRQHDADLPGRPAGRPDGALRRGQGRRRRALGDVPAHHPADDLAGPLLQPDHHADRRRSSTSPRPTSSATAAATRTTRRSSSTSTSTARRSSFYHMGYASALAWLLFAIVLVLTIVLFRTAGAWVYEARRRPMTAVAAPIAGRSSVDRGPLRRRMRRFTAVSGDDAARGHDRVGLPAAAACHGRRPSFKDTGQLTAARRAALPGGARDAARTQGEEYPRLRRADARRRRSASLALVKKGREESAVRRSGQSGRRRRSTG